jgi:hypothetical protein
VKFIRGNTGAMLDTPNELDKKIGIQTQSQVTRAENPLDLFVYSCTIEQFIRYLAAVAISSDSAVLQRM